MSHRWCSYLNCILERSIRSKHPRCCECDVLDCLRGPHNYCCFLKELTSILFSVLKEFFVGSSFNNNNNNNTNLLIFIYNFIKPSEDRSWFQFNVFFYSMFIFPFHEFETANSEEQFSWFILMESSVVSVFECLKKIFWKKRPNTQPSTANTENSVFIFCLIHRSIMIKLFVTNAIAWCVYTAEHAKKTTENHFSGFRLIDNH